MSRLSLFVPRMGIFCSNIWKNPQKLGNTRNVAAVTIHSRDSHTLPRNRAQTPRLLQCSPASLTQTVSFSWKTDPDQIPKSLPDKGKLVYIGALTNPMRIVKAFSLSTSICGLAAQPVILTGEQMPMWLKVAVGGTMSIFIFATPLVLHFITKRYVTHMYYDQDTNKFSATTVSLFLQEKEHQFTSADIKVPEMPTPLTTVKAKGFPLLLDPNTFMDKTAFIKLMKYDEPIDWQLPNDDEEQVDNKDSHKK